MSERVGRTDEPGGDSWAGPEDPAMAAPEFTASEFEADAIAAARMMPDGAATDTAAGRQAPIGRLPRRAAPSQSPSESPSQSPWPGIFAAERARRTLAAELARLVGPEHARAAGRALLTNYARRLSDAPDAPPAVPLRRAALWLARRLPGDDPARVEAFAVRLVQVLGLRGQARGAAAEPSAADLRAASQALRQAARHLLRVERRLALRLEDLLEDRT
jgi:hypothetical protein